MPDEPTSPTTSRFPFAFVVVTFAVSAVIGVAVAFYGMHGQLGWGIP